MTRPMDAFPIWLSLRVALSATALTFVEPAPHPRLAHLLLNLRHAAEFDRGPAPGLLLAQSCVDEFGNPPIDVVAQLSFELAARVELEPEVKQGLLQDTSEHDRLERVCELLVEAAVTVERQRRAAERASTNGRVDLS